MIYPDVVQTSAPLATDGDVVNWILSLAVKKNSRGLMNGLIGEQGASNDQVIKDAELYKKFFILILHSDAVSVHNEFAICVISIYHGSHVYGFLDSLIKFVILFKGCQIDRSVALNGGNFSAL